jgi:hypothetical protein
MFTSVARSRNGIPRWHATTTAQTTAYYKLQTYLEEVELFSYSNSIYSGSNSVFLYYIFFFLCYVARPPYCSVSDRCGGKTNSANDRNRREINRDRGAESSIVMGTDSTVTRPMDADTEPTQSVKQRNEVRMD